MIKTFFIALLFFCIIDVFWIYFVATPMYKLEVPSLMELKVMPAIFFYITVNMSMVLGLLPIVGSPLPLLSYGGSSMLATMIGFAIVMSAKINHKQLIA